MPIPRSVKVNGCVNWLRVLPILGVTPRSSVLPTVLRCPLCSENRLYIYQNTLSGGEWHHCRACSSSGDIISLAAFYWKIDPLAALKRLAAAIELPEDANIELYSNGLEDNRLVTNLLRQPVNAVVLKKMLQAVDATVRDPEQWATELGRFATVAHKQEISDAVSPRRTGKHALFEPVWDTALVVPFHDLPGRISAVWVGDAERERMLNIESINYNHRWPDLGIGMFEAVAGDPDPEFGDLAFIVNDVRMAVRLHDRSFQNRSRPLPVAASMSDDVRWSMFDSGVLKGRKLVFWSQKLTTAAVRMAKAGDGVLATADDVNESPIRHLSRFSPSHWLRHITDTAVHWTLALDALIAKLPDAEVEVALLTINLSTDERQRFFAACSSASRDRLRELYGPNMNRRIAIDGFHVHEKGGCWYLSNPAKPWIQSLLSDATFRIEQIIRMRDRERVYYKIRVFFRSRELVFIVRADEFEKAPIAHVKSELIKAGIGMMTSTKCWSTDVVAIATQFWQPEFVDGEDRFGWSDRRMAWVFETFSIDSRGAVGEGVSVVPGNSSRPTSRLTPPTDLHPDDVALLSRDDDFNKLIWATTACVISNLVAPIANRTTSGIALIGPGAVFVGQSAGRLLGCDEYNMPVCFGSDYVTKTIADSEVEHGWPLILERSKSSRGYNTTAWLASPGPRNCVTELDWYVARAVAMIGGWHLIESDRQYTSIAEYTRALPALVPLFLRWLGLGGLAMPDDKTLGHSVLSSLSEWFGSVGGDPNVVLEAHRVTTLALDDDPGATIADRLAEILCRLCTDGEIAVGVPAGKKIPFMPYTGSGQLFVPKAALNRILALKGAPVPDGAVLTQGLAKAGVLLQELDCGSPPVPGWEVQRDWWDKKLELWTRNRKYALRVVG